MIKIPPIFFKLSNKHPLNRSLTQVGEVIGIPNLSQLYHRTLRPKAPKKKVVKKKVVKKKAVKKKAVKKKVVKKKERSSDRQERRGKQPENEPGIPPRVSKNR